jgi:diguanylate cyclase (GGDEF)-like protein/PAS domain S-box-containing protein
MFKEVHIDGLEERVGAPQMRDLLARYQSLARGGSIPAYADFNPDRLPQYSSNLAVVEPIGNGDYLYVHYGRTIFENSGVEMLGSKVSQWQSEVGSFFCEAYDRACAERRPIYTVHRAHHAIRVHLWERLVLPTGAPNGSIQLVVFNKPREYLDDLLKTVLEASPEGILALRCMRHADGRIEDAMVITANERAAAILGHSVTHLLDRPILQIIPDLRGSRTWSRYLEVVETRRSQRFELPSVHGGEERWFDVKAAPLGDGFMVSFADVTTLKTACHELETKNARLAEEISRRQELEGELRRIADVDVLTGVASRRAFMIAAERGLERVAGIMPLSVIALDVDHFKHINDRYGHNVGDKVLSAIGRELLHECRGGDVVGRLGGEEFAILLPNTTLDDAVAIAERLRERMSDMTIAVTEATRLSVRASFGVAPLWPGDSCETLLSRADECLYRAKKDGRDRVVATVVNDAPSEQDSFRAA